ncbi:hypothetical protein IJ384_05735 [bacterium]|nr:hypothetical protein [bacterium]
MKRKLSIFFIASILLTCSAKAEFGFDTPADYTGEAFFASPSLEQPNGVGFGSDSRENRGTSHTTPPIKQLRLKLQEMERAKEQQYYELAPTADDVYSGEIETSEYASKEIEDNFEEMNPDGFEADGEFIEESAKPKKRFFKKKKKEKLSSDDTESIVLDCEKVNYDTDNYLVYATGNVNVEFVKQKINVKADIITFDRMNNTIKAEGNVKIIKNDKVVTGDYIFVDMNEENALIENPLTKSGNIEIRSQKGYVYGDKIVQEKGTMEVKESFPINFHSGNRGPQMRRMMVPKNETLSDDMEKGIITFQAKDIKITQKGEHEIVALTKPRFYKGDKLIFKTPSVKIYTNKNHDYFETDHWEIGSIRGLGLYVGPGFVTELPKGSVFKLMPMLNYKSGLGAGAVGRFYSGTNSTTLAYGTSTGKFLAYGRQELDDNLFLQYATNSYMNEWFLGRRRPKYGVSLVYEKSYGANGFLIKDKRSGFKHRIEGGYYHDLDFDRKYENINGSDIGTTRFRYMAEARQNFFEHVDRQNLKALRFDLVSQLSSAIYGTGDTQVIGRLGPALHVQYKRWMQDIGYYFSVYDDNTPIPVYDAYRYGKQSIYLREYFRVCRWLTLSWFGTMNLTGDAPNDKTFQENGFYVSLGPDDLKFNVGYDFIRETLRCTVEVMMDAKGTKVEYDRFELTQDNKPKKEKKTVAKKENPNLAPVQPKVLQRAVVEDIKVHEDVL